MKTYVLAGLLVALIPAAHGADLVATEPTATPSYSEPSSIYSDSSFDWSGVYAGVIAGYAKGEAQATGEVTGLTTDIGFSGALLGGTIGINHQIDSFVLGLEGDIAWSGANGYSPCASNTAFSCEGNLNWLGTVRARAGMDFDSVLVFATAGLAAAEVSANINPAAAGITNTFTGTMTGWTIGAGVEAAVTDAISVKAEYSYYDLGNLQAPAQTIASDATNLSAIHHVMKIGVNYHF